jgi:Domain of unknown function (DUF1902)
MADEGVKVSMRQHEFAVLAVWDEDAEVYYSESDILGLHIETKTLDEFEAVMVAAAGDLIRSNHRRTPSSSSGLSRG